MSGRVYQLEQLSGQLMKMTISFGGLLMEVTGDQGRMAEFGQDDPVFALMNKLG